MAQKKQSVTGERGLGAHSEAEAGAKSARFVSTGLKRRNPHTGDVFTRTQPVVPTHRDGWFNSQLDAGLIREF